jgi:diguanylate cyclase (GGDEF)-like protein/PAS domain S-box-containing protein
MTARRIVTLFLAFGIAWIWVSDRAIDFLVSDSRTVAWIQSAKGMLFVALSALLIYILVRRAEKTQAALKAEAVHEKDRLAQILDVTPAVIYALKVMRPGDPRMTAHFVSHNVEAFTGHPLVSWMNDPGFWLNQVHPDDRAAVEAANAHLHETGSLTHEYRLRHALGGYRWIHDHLILLRDAAGQPEQILGAWMDVTDRKEAELATAESEQRYRDLYEHNPMPMWVFDVETLRFLSVNAAAIAKYGYSRQEFLSMTVLDIRSADDHARVKGLVAERRHRPNGHAASGTWRHLAKDGRAIWVEISGHGMHFDGRPARLVLAHDITDRREVEGHAQLIASVFDASQEGISITDAQGRYISVNQAFTRITGYGIDDLVGKTPAILKSGHHDSAFFEEMWRHILTEGRWEGEIWNRRKTGEVYPEWLTISAIHDGDGKVTQYLAIFTETSSRKAAEERIERLVNYDQLTNLPNRALLQDRAKVALASSSRTHVPVAVMQLNIDHFRNINETMGPEAGDQVLITIAQRLQGVLRPEDTVSRLSADEFIVLLPNTPVQDVPPIALRLMTAVDTPFTLNGQEMRLTASIGIAEFPENGADLARLIQSAGSAVHQAKREGRNTFRFFSHSLQEQVKESLLIERDLRYAVERDQLVLHYQAQMNVHTKRIVGVEALVRWRHPDWGLVPPGKFIPIAEESGLIRQIGQWVLQTAVAQNQSWRQAGLAIVPVAINLSPAEFKDPQLRDAIITVLRDSGLPTNMVELELTESVAMEDTNFTIATIEELKRLGVTLSIDDFGTGYSSLSSLKRFAVDKLKIDQSFVRGLNFDRQDEAIVKTMINLAQSLGLETIAEGVETEEQLAFLQANGCETAQGYLFSRPVPAEDFAALLRTPVWPFDQAQPAG